MSHSGEDRPIPNGYYEMTVQELRSFINSATYDPIGAKIRVEIDGERFPVIKLTRDGAGGAVILRVPPKRVGT